MMLGKCRIVFSENINKFISGISNDTATDSFKQFVKEINGISSKIETVNTF